MGRSRASVERMLTPLLPVGTSVPRTLHVLDSLKVEHSDLTEDVIYANFGMSRGSLLGGWGIYGEFSFDAAGKLVRREVTRKSLGP